MTWASPVILKNTGSDTAEGMLGKESGLPGRWSLGVAGSARDVPEALRIGIVNDCVPRDQLMPTVMNVAERIAKVPRHSVRCMKRMIMSGFLSFGLAAAMELCCAMSALGHSSHGPDRQSMFDAHVQGGFRAFLDVRDGPFQPEPMGGQSPNQKDRTGPDRSPALYTQ